MPRATADVSVVIDRPVSEVFAYMANYENNVNWQEGVVSSRQVTPGEPRVGTRVSYTRALAGREIETEAEMTRLDVDRAIRIKSGSRVFTYEGGYDFHEQGDGTRVHYQGAIETSRLLGPVGRLLAGKFQSQMEQDLTTLKHRLEAAG